MQDRLSVGKEMLGFKLKFAQSRGKRKEHSERGFIYLFIYHLFSLKIFLI